MCQHLRTVVDGGACGTSLHRLGVIWPAQATAVQLLAGSALRASEKLLQLRRGGCRRYNLRGPLRSDVSNEIAWQRDARLCACCRGPRAVY